MKWLTISFCFGTRHVLKDVVIYIPHFLLYFKILYLELLSMINIQILRGCMYLLGLLCTLLLYSLFIDSPPLSLNLSSRDCQIYFSCIKEWEDLILITQLLSSIFHVFLGITLSMANVKFLNRNEIVGKLCTHF